VSASLGVISDGGIQRSASAGLNGDKPAAVRAEIIFPKARTLRYSRRATMRTLLLTRSETEVLLEPDTLLATCALRSAAIHSIVTCARKAYVPACPDPGPPPYSSRAPRQTFPPTPSRCTPSFRSSDPRSAVCSVCATGKPASFSPSWTRRISPQCGRDFAAPWPRTCSLGATRDLWL
jgi:hypothetical protein